MPSTDTRGLSALVTVEPILEQLLVPADISMVNAGHPRASAKRAPPLPRRRPSDDAAGYCFATVQEMESMTQLAMSASDSIVPTTPMAWVPVTAHSSAPVAVA